MTSKQSAEEIEAIKLGFISAWNKGDKPTLAEYTASYPQYAMELTEFVLLFSVMETVTDETDEVGEPSSELVALVQGAVESSQSSAETLNERIKEIGATPDELAAEFDLPVYILGMLQKRQLTHLPLRLVIALRHRFSQTTGQVLGFIGYRPPMPQTAFQFRADSTPATTGTAGKTFREAMASSANAEQKRKWLPDDDMEQTNG